MTRRKSIFRKAIICAVIMLMCLLTGVDDITGCLQPVNLSRPVLQNGNGQDDGDDHLFRPVQYFAAWRDAADIAGQLSFLRFYPGEIKGQSRFIRPEAIHTRAPPAIS